MNSFERAVTKIDTSSLTCQSLENLQVNVGLRCNHKCAHCHLRASPERSEMMTWKTMKKILKVVEAHDFSLIDITGGAPELHPELQRFITHLHKQEQTIQVRTNLTVLHDTNLMNITSFFAEHDVNLVASLPCYTEENVDSQRGTGVFKKCILALQELNRVGYGIKKQLTMNLVHNPLGPYLPPSQESLEEDYRSELKNRFNIEFSNLFTITNMPIGRFDDQLNATGEKNQYCELLQHSLNPSTVQNIMCRHQICVGWDGRLFDCDFNLALNLPVTKGIPQNIADFNYETLSHRPIITGDYCFGCTAGHGSSCGGALA